jgi:hypothetical protein
MQRVRIGLTGLACVFLLVLLGAIFVKFVRDGEAARTIQIGPNLAAMDNGADVPKEPLAELGITPGNVPSGDEKYNSSSGQAPAVR